MTVVAHMAMRGRIIASLLLLCCLAAQAQAQAGKTLPLNQKRLNKEENEATNQATNAVNNGNAEALGMAGSSLERQRTGPPRTVGYLDVAGPLTDIDPDVRHWRRVSTHF